MLRRTLAAAAAALCCMAAAAHADRRYFVQSYTPYLSAAGDLDLEIHSIARSGQGDSSATAWDNRIEFEYGISDRLTGAAYLNFVQDPGPESPMKFDGPSLEFIYQIASPGAWLVDPAAYFEVRANGSEVEMEPKLLLGKRIYKLVSAVNVIGEIEHHSSGLDANSTEKALHVTAGTSREIGHAVAIGIEAVYSHEFLDNGPDATRWLIGPTINVQAPKVQLALGWHPQVSGAPASSGSLNLADFPRSEVRLIVGIEL